MASTKTATALKLAEKRTQLKLLKQEVSDLAAEHAFLRAAQKMAKTQNAEARKATAIEKAKAKNEAVPPGLYAHLGLLNLNINNAPRAIEYFELERQVYPESTVLMDRLLKKMTTRSVEVKTP